MCYVGGMKKTVTGMDEIHVNFETNTFSYPEVKGFELDMERVYRSIERFLPFCSGSLEMAAKHAIHEQLSAHRGMQSVRRFASRNG